MKSHTLFDYGILLLANIACSSAVILIKISHVPAAWVGACRLLIAALILSPIYWTALKKEPPETVFSLSHSFRRSMVPGLLLALHFIIWNHGVRNTSAAHATLIVNMGPLVTPVLIWFMLRDRLNRWEVTGTAFGLGGVYLLSSADFAIDPSQFMGDVLCFVGMVFGTTYFVMARTRCVSRSIWVYLVPIYTIAGIICALFALLAGEDPRIMMQPAEWLPLIGLALIPTIIGHSCLNRSMRALHPQLVTIAGLSQFIFAGILAYFILGEGVIPQFYPAAVIVCTGAGLAIYGHRQRGRQPSFDKSGAASQS